MMVYTEEGRNPMVKNQLGTLFGSAVNGRPTGPDSVIDAPVQGRTQGLWRKGVLVQMQGGVWSMETRLTADDLNIGANQIPGFATLGKKRLLDAKHKNEFLNVIGKARSAAERLGFNFVLTGSYFVPFGNFERLKEVVTEQQVEFYRLADRFIENYTERRAEYLEKYSEYWEKLDPFYPAPEVVRSYFKFNRDTLNFHACGCGQVPWDQSPR